MNVVNFNQRTCEKYRRYFDAYIDNELLIETNQDVLQHVTSCPECAAILEERARMKQLVRSAVSKEEAPPELSAAIRGIVHERRPSFFGYNTARWATAAAAVVVLAVIGLRITDWNTLRQLGGNTGMVQTVSARVQDLLRLGLIDHVHCTILLRRWTQFISPDEMKANTSRQALGPEFIDLVPKIQAKLGRDYKLIQGHRCVANHRQYVHFILTGKNDTILSIVITEKNNESFTEAEAVAIMNASGIPVYGDHQGQLEVAAFESNKYLAYVISNLNRRDNLGVASAMVPELYNHLHQLEL